MPTCAFRITAIRWSRMEKARFAVMHPLSLWSVSSLPTCPRTSIIIPHSVDHPRTPFEDSEGIERQERERTMNGGFNPHQIWWCSRYYNCILIFLFVFNNQSFYRGRSRSKRSNPAPQALFALTCTCTPRQKRKDGIPRNHTMCGIGFDSIRFGIKRKKEKQRKELS